MQRYENHAIFVALRAYFFNILYYRKLLHHLLLNLGERLEEIVAEVADGFDGSILQIPHAAVQVLAHGATRNVHESCLRLVEVDVLHVLLVVIQRSQGELVGSPLHMAHVGNLILFEIEEEDEYAALQLCHALDAQLAEPLVELHEIHLVALGAQVVAHLDDAAQVDAVGKNAIDVRHDDAQQVQGLDGSIDGVTLIFLDVGESSVQETIVHAYFARRNIVEILHHLGNLLLLECSHGFHLLFNAEVGGTQLGKKVPL